MLAEEFFIGKKLLLHKKVGLSLQRAKHQASIGWCDHRPRSLWHWTTLPVADLSFEDRPGRLCGNVRVHTFMEVDPTGLKKAHDAKPFGTKGQGETQQSKELGRQAVTGQEPQEPGSLSSDRFGVEKLHELIAAQPLSAQSSSITLNVLMLHVVHHILLLVSSSYQAASRGGSSAYIARCPMTPA